MQLIWKFVDISYVKKQFIKIWNLLFDTLSPVGYLQLIMLIKFVIFVWAMLLAQMLWKFGVELYK